MKKTNLLDVEKKTLERLHNRCSLCGTSEDINIVDVISIGGIVFNWNLDVLCKTCQLRIRRLLSFWKEFDWKNFPKITVVKEIRVRAAHQLRDGYEGKCCRVHGEFYKIVFKVSSLTTDQFGMTIDFNVFDKLVKDKYDHYFLNDIEPFNKINPTAENIARVLFWKLNDIFDYLPHRPRLEYIKVVESDDNSYVEYSF